MTIPSGNVCLFVGYDEMCMAAVNQKLLLKEERLWKYVSVRLTRVCEWCLCFLSDSKYRIWACFSWESGPSRSVFKARWNNHNGAEFWWCVCSFLEGFAISNVGARIQRATFLVARHNVWFGNPFRKEGGLSLRTLAIICFSEWFCVLSNFGGY